MFLENTERATTVVSGTGVLPDYQHETVRHMVFGSLTAVRLTIQDLHKRRYAEPNDWSKPISTGRPNDVMAILTKRIAISS
ncbi:MAG: hypothetical protein AAGI69_18760 [Cyanobacteria bacterium P01_H01_bin.21]